MRKKARTMSKKARTMRKKSGRVVNFANLRMFEHRLREISPCERR